MSGHSVDVIAAGLAAAIFSIWHAWDWWRRRKR